MKMSRAYICCNEQTGLKSIIRSFVSTWSVHCLAPLSVMAHLKSFAERCILRCLLVSLRDSRARCEFTGAKLTRTQGLVENCGDLEGLKKATYVCEQR